MSDTLDGVPALSELRYEDLCVGDRFGPFEEPVRSGVSDRLRGPVGDHRSGSLAPPIALILVTLRALRCALAGIPPGGVLLRQRLNVHEALPAQCDLIDGVRVSAQKRRERDRPAPE